MMSDAKEKMKRLEESSNDELLERAWSELSALCGSKTRPKKWRMSIPVNADKDSDVLFGEVLQRFSKLNDEVIQLEAELLQYKADLRATDGQVVELEAMLKQAAENDFHSEVVQTEMLQLELEENPWMGAKQYKEDWIETWLCALREGEG